MILSFIVLLLAFSLMIIIGAMGSFSEPPNHYTIRAIICGFCGFLVGLVLFIISRLKDIW